MLGVAKASQPSEPLQQISLLGCPALMEGQCHTNGTCMYEVQPQGTPCSVSGDFCLTVPLDAPIPSCVHVQGDPCSILGIVCPDDRLSPGDSCRPLRCNFNLAQLSPADACVEVLQASRQPCTAQAPGSGTLFQGVCILGEDGPLCTADNMVCAMHLQGDACYPDGDCSDCCVLRPLKDGTACKALEPTWVLSPNPSPLASLPPSWQSSPNPSSIPSTFLPTPQCWDGLRIQLAQDEGQNAVSDSFEITCVGGTWQWPAHRIAAGVSNHPFQRAPATVQTGVGLDSNAMSPHLLSGSLWVLPQIKVDRENWEECLVSPEMGSPLPPVMRPDCLLPFSSSCACQ
eukprot:gene8375-1494_t